MKKLLIALMIFLIGIVLFMPKEHLFFTLRKYLKKEHIEILSSSLSDRWLYLNMDDALLIYDGIESLEAKRVIIKPWIFYNQIEAKDLLPVKSLRNILNIKADDLKITQNIFKPMIANLVADGKFGEISGYIDLKKRTIHLLLRANKGFENSKVVRDYFRKSKEGLVYESNF